jgi:[acyl-carrier-protein] S-malonyltransferase
MGKTAFVFAGQGAQAVGMAQDFYVSSDRVKSLFAMAETKRKGITGLVFEGPKELLDITVHTQPALFLADLACAHALTEHGVSADGAAGFSLGEIPAACYCGLMEEAQAFDFVCCRSEAMQAISEKQKGAMFAILQLPTGSVEGICAMVNHAYPVNYNCPGQTVAACAESSADELKERVAQAGGKAVRLHTGGAFHSPLMDAAAERLAAWLAKEPFGATRIPLYANATADVYGDPKELLAKQVNHPVLWQKTIERMISDGFDTFIEAGPGKTLCGLIRRISPDVRTYNVSDAASLEKTLEVLRHA